MNRFTYSALVLLFAFAYTKLAAQVDRVYTGEPVTKPNEQKKNWMSDDLRDRLLWGGNVQAWMGNPTFIYLSPTIGFKVTDEFHLGTGFIYNYTSYRTYAGNFSQSIFGGHSHARYIFAESVFVQLQYDRLKQPNWFSNDPGAMRWVDYLMLGGGFRQSAGNNAALITSIMYNLRPDPLSIYPNRLIIQFGFVGGF